MLVCPSLEELVLYVESRDQLDIERLANMAKNLASREAGLLAITIVCLSELALRRVYKLGDRVTRVEIGVEEEPPAWDDLAWEYSDEGEQG